MSCFLWTPSGNSCPVPGGTGLIFSLFWSLLGKMHAYREMLYASLSSETSYLNLPLPQQSPLHAWSSSVMNHRRKRKHNRTSPSFLLSDGEKLNRINCFMDSQNELSASLSDNARRPYCKTEVSPGSLAPLLLLEEARTHEGSLVGPTYCGWLSVVESGVHDEHWSGCNAWGIH